LLVRPSAGRFDVGGKRLATAPIRGRADELKMIGALVTALVRGRGGVLVIEGPPGIGKSRLLTEVCALADKAGVRTLFGEAFQYQQTVPFSRCSWRRCAPIRPLETPKQCGGWAVRRTCGTWVVRDLARAIRAAAAESPLAIGGHPLGRQRHAVGAAVAGNDARCAGVVGAHCP
jgi:predicted ATPase